MLNTRTLAAFCGLVLAATVVGQLSQAQTPLPDPVPSQPSAQQPSQQAAQQRPLADYVSYPNFRSAKLSPDGAYIAVVVPNENKENVLILDAKTIQVKASFQTQTYTKVGYFMWANEERIVFMTAINVDGGDQVGYTGDIFAFNVDNTKKFAVAGPAAGDNAAFQLMDSLEDDHDHILAIRKDPKKNSLARSRPQATKIDIYREPSSKTSQLNGSKSPETVVSPLPWGNLYTDNTGKVRVAVAVGEDGKLQAKLKQGEQWQDLISFLETSKDPHSALGQPLGFNSKDDGIYYLSRTPQGTYGISLFDFASSQSRLMYADDKYDVDTEGLLYSNDGKDIIGVEIMGQQAERHYFSPEHPDVAFRKDLDKAIGGNSVRFQNFTKDQRKGLAIVSGPAIAPTLFMIDRDAGSFSPLFSSRPKLQGLAMTKPELLTIKSRDGVNIDAYLTKAIGVQGPAPLIVYIHGGPHGIRDVPVFDSSVKLMASRGYSVLQVNYRGSGGYGEKFLQAGYRHWGTTMIDDVIDATRYVTEQHMVKADQICVMGASFGGYSAMMAVARYPDLFKCGVGMSGVYDLNLMRKSDTPYFPGGDEYMDMIIGADKQELAANSPVTLASNIKVPIFLAHGGADKRVPVENAEVFKKALDKALVKYEWFYMVNAGHGFTLPDTREKFYTELFKFLETNLH